VDWWVILPPLAGIRVKTIKRNTSYTGSTKIVSTQLVYEQIRRHIRRLGEQSIILRVNWQITLRRILNPSMLM